jgi:hypothetical protein
MQKRILILAAAAFIVSTASLLPTRANAMGVGTATAIDNALAELDMMQNVATVCRWRYGRRYCTWVPTVRYYRPYRYRYVRPYRRYYRRW